MSLDTVYRAALGSTAALGDMYDARTDSFCGVSVLKREIPEAARVFIDSPSSDIEYIYTDKMSEKFSKLNVHAELQVSILLGLLTLSGSGSYINDKKESARSVKASLVYNLRTKDEKLTVFHEDMKHVYSLDAIRNSHGCTYTHFVTEIEWGANSMLTCEQENTENKNEKEISGKLAARMRLIGAKIEGLASLNFTEGGSVEESSFKFRLFGDVMPDAETPTTIEAAVELIKKVPKLITSSNKGAGKPVAFRLLPIAVLKDYLQVEMTADTIVRNIQSKTLTKVTKFFEELEGAKQITYDFYNDVTDELFATCISKFDTKAVRELKNSLDITEQDIKYRLAKILKSVRSGDSGTEEIDNFLSEFYSSPMSPQNITDIVNDWSHISSTIQFARKVKRHGAIYICSAELMDLIEDAPDQKTVAFYFKEGARTADEARWNENINIFFNELYLSKNISKFQKFYVIDGNFQPFPSNESSFIKVYRGGRTIIDDLLADRLEKQDKAMIQWTDIPIKTVGENPSTVPFEAKCAGTLCNPSKIYSWTCEKCGELVKLGSDHQLYCACGRSRLSSTSFKCSDPRHGFQYNSHSDDYLNDLLNHLRPITTPKPTTAKPEEDFIKWVTARDGHLPSGALLAGYEPPNHLAYVIRTRHNGNIVAGKYIGRLKNWYPAWYALAGKGYKALEYDALVANPSRVRWQLVEGRNIPTDAVKAGHRSFDGQGDIYVCRVAYQDRLIPGQCSNASGKCFVELHGKEYAYQTYEILIQVAAK